MATSLLQIVIKAINQSNQAFKELTNDINGVNRASQQMVLPGMQDWFKNASAGASGVSTGMGSIVAAATKAIAAIGAVTIATKELWTASQEGAQMLTTMQTATAIASTFGQNMREIVDSVQSASLETVTEYDATLAVSQALMFGLQGSAEDFGNLMEIAAFRGRAFGMTATQAFSDIVRGIGRLSPLILDNIGITIDADNTYKQYAESMGKVAGELSSTEKRQALLNRVIEEGNRLMEEAGGLTYSTATAFERINVKWKEFWNNVKTGLAEGILPLLSTEDEIIEYHNTVNASLEKTGATYAEYVKNRKNQMEELGYYIDTEGNLYKRSFSWAAGAIQVRNNLIATNTLLSKSEWEARQAFATGEEAAQDIEIRRFQIQQLEELAFATNEVSNAYATQIGIAGQLSKIQETYFEDVRKSKTATIELSDSINEFIYEAADATGVLSDTANTQLAFALDQIDVKSYATASAIQLLTQAFDRNGSGMIDTMGESSQLSEALIQLSANANAAIKDRSATWSITMLLNGIEMPAGGLENWSFLPGRTGAYYSAPRFSEPRASGGGVGAGSSYLVGEQGPELFIPSQSGQITTNDRGGKNITVHINYNPMVSTASQSEVEWILKPMIQRVIKEVG